MQFRAGLTVRFVTYPLPARNALFRIKALVFQLVVPNSRMPNNLTKRLTHPTSSSYYATQYFQSPFLCKKAVRKSDQVPVMGRNHQRHDVAVQLQTHHSFFPLGYQSQQSLRQKSRIAAHQREAGKYQDQYQQAVPTSLRPGLVCHCRKGSQCLLMIAGYYYRLSTNTS